MNCTVIIFVFIFLSLSVTFFFITAHTCIDLIFGYINSIQCFFSPKILQMIQDFSIDFISSFLELLIINNFRISRTQFQNF